MNYDRGSALSSAISTGQSFDVGSFIKNGAELHGTFNGTAQWCSDLASTNWRPSSVVISEQGSLSCLPDSSKITTTSQSFRQATEDLPKDPWIKHLQGCQIHLIEGDDNTFPIIQLTTQSQRDFFQASDRAGFEGLLCSLIWWSALRTKGIFNKTLLNSTCLSSAEENPSNLLVSQLVVYGPLPNRRIPVIKHLSRPSFLKKSKVEEGWFPAMGVLKADGTLDLLLQSDGSLIYSLDIKSLIRSEIRLLDPSLQTDNMLFVGTIPDLRLELGVSKRIKFVLGGPTLRNDTNLVLKFPLSIDVEDWLVALKSFAQAEYLSLAGAHESNRLRISNRFKISIVEGDFPGVSIASHGGVPRLYVELSIWDYNWGRTAIVQGTDTPFWREEFTFDESIKISNLRVEVKQRIQKSGEDEVVGFVQITQDMINDLSLNKETRLPVIDAKNGRFKIGTICIRIISSLNFILPPANFFKFESALTEVNLSQVVNSVRNFALGSDLTFEDIAGILLDVFQVLHKEDDWFSALIDREVLELDGSITRNNKNNRTSTHIYGTLFRGNSILTRSMESFFYRVGKEYLDASIGPALRSIISAKGSCEVDPERIKEDDPAKKDAILKQNHERLLKTVEDIWMAIYRTSNDIPMPIKNQMMTLRKKLELICIEDGATRVLNCVSGMLFLRFFCPVILNPKLFNLVRSHLDEQSRRTVTLVSKVLLNLSNLSTFGNKEPYMKGMNCFIDEHRGELLDYIDKVTQKKLDFAPKKLRLTNTLARPKLMMNQKILAELPTNPYLIDRYLRETELFTVFAICAIKKEGYGQMPRSLSVGQVSKDIANIETSVEERRTEVGIGELEFEKITENNVEIFGHDLYKYLKQDEEMNAEQITGSKPDLEGDSMEQLERESTLLFHRIEHLKRLFADYEFPAGGEEEKMKYAQYLADNTYCTRSREIVVDPLRQLPECDVPKRLFSTSETPGVLDNIAPRLSTQSGSSGSISVSDGSSSVTRKLSRFKTPRIGNFILRGGDESDISPNNGGGFKRWFKRK